MAELLTEAFVQRAIGRHLQAAGWSHNLVTRRGKAHGVDIRVRNDRFSHYFLVEVKGDPDQPQNLLDITGFEF